MEALKQIEDLLAAKFAVVKDIYSIIKLETRLAGLSVFPLLFSIGMLIVMLLTAWLTTMMLLVYGLFLAIQSLLIAILLVFLFNLIFLLIVVKYLLFNLKCMSFEKTREYFSKNQSSEHEKLQRPDLNAN